MKILGLDIGTYSVKVAEIDVTSKGYVLSAFHEMHLSLDPQKDRKLEIIETLRQFSANFDASNTRWVMGVAQDRVSVHQKRFPFRERPKIIKSLPFELEDEIPLDIDDTIFDAKITDYAGLFAEVLTVACPKDVVEEVLALAKDGGFDVDIVSVEGLALANVFENPELPPPEKLAPLKSEDEEPASAQPPTPARLILHLGNSHSNLLVYRDGAMVAVRSLQWGGADIADAVVQTFQVPIFEAVKVLESRSFILMNSAGATKDQIHLSTTIASSVDGLLGELRLVLLEIRSAFNLKFETMDITGGAGQIQNLGAYLTQHLEIPANVIRPYENLRQVRMDFTAHMEAVSVVAVGLALEGVKRPRNPAINLRQNEFALQNESLKRFWETWRLPLQVGAAMFCLFFAFAVIRNSMATGLDDKADDHVSEMAKKVAGLKGASASQSGVETYISKQKKLINDRDALSKAENVNSAMDILAKIAGKVPVIKPFRAGSGLNVSHLNIDNEDVTIEGHVDQANARILQSALTEIARPKSFQTLKQSPPGNAPGVPFAYKFKVERTRL
jgi:general secretion pathway protein L